MTNITFDQWARTPDLQRQWRETWEQEHMQLGLLLMLKAVAHNRGPQSETTEQHSLSSARRLGFGDALRMIEILKNSPDPAANRDPDPAPWEHMMSPPAQPPEQ